MEKRFFSFSVVLLSLTLSAFPHGTDKPGPHGGYISMPGAFHTEVVPVRAGEWRVYLLDQSLKNPTVRGSSLFGSIQFGDRSIAITCTEGDDYFICRLPNPISKLVPTKMKLEAKRGTEAGGIAIYNLPLAFR